jgi:DNA repair protein SbcC/Rad50
MIHLLLHKTPNSVSSEPGAAHDAAKTWENILKVYEQARLRLKALRDEEKSLQRQVASADALIATLTEGASSDLVRHRLLNMVRQQNWRPPTAETADVLAAQLIGPLSELVALTRQAADLPISPTPSRNTLDRLTTSLHASREKVSADIKVLAGLERQINIVSADIERARGASITLQGAIRLVAAGIPARLSERNLLRQSVASLLNQLTGIDRAAISAAAAQHPDTDAATYLTRASAARAEAAAALERTRAEHQKLQSTRERSANLADELREIAIQLLSETGNESQCPLCHTAFGTDELFAHINSELSSQIDRSEEQLADRLRQLEEVERNTMLDESVAKAFVAFASRAGLIPDTTLVQIAAAVDRAENDLSEASEQLWTGENALKHLEGQGLRWIDLEPTRIELMKRRFPLRDWSSTATELLDATIASFINEQDRMLTDCVKSADKLRQQIGAVLGENVETAEQARVGLSGLEQRSAAAESLAKKLAALDKSFSIPKTKALGELSVEAEAIRQVAVELQIAIQQERDNKAVRAQTHARRAELHLELEKLAPRIKNLSAAANVLQRLQREHSLHAAMQEAIRQNRSSIEAIFGKIHAPREFSGLGEDITTLRRLDGTVANLTEISTGQRSALGLSMFLAQNMKLVCAPPVILIDDPIAHVDDLNCLSFLDYLREIALTKRRQIFFSTANEKLAAMFERKFDFLAPPEFRKIVLHRESTAPYPP